MNLITIRLAGAVALAFVVSACASMTVRSYSARGLDVHAFKTYDWGPVEQRATGDPRLDSNRVFQDHVRSAIDRQLAAKGFRQTDGPQLLVRYYVNVTQQVYARRGAPDVRCEDCGPDVYDSGTLLIDLVDARTHRLVWRGWAEGGIDGVIDDQAWLEARIDQAVARVLGRL